MNKATKRILTILGVAAGTFLLVSVGAYLVMPSFAPSLEASSGADSSATEDSSAAVAQASSDTLDAAGASSSLPPAVDTTKGTGRVRPATARRKALISTLRDSIETLKQRLKNTESETARLEEKASTLESQLADAKGREMKASELSSALLDMRNRELGALLKKVNMSVLEQLYQRASGRSRTRLLQSMSPNRAARFVNQVVEGNVSADSSDSTAVSEPPLSSSPQ